MHAHTARYAPVMSNKHDTREKKYLTRKAHQRQALPIHGPAILGQEFFACSLERIVRPQVLEGHRLSGERVDARLFHVLYDTAAVKAGAGGSYNGIVHDFEGNSVNEVVGYNLIPVLVKSQPCVKEPPR